MNRSEVLEFITKKDKAWQDHDAEALTACHAEDGVIESPLFGNVKGTGAIYKSNMEWFATFPDSEYLPEHILIDGDRVAQFIKVTGTHQRDFCGFPATGKRIQFRASTFLFLHEGKIKREIRTYDYTGFLLQLGVLKAKPAF